MCLFVYVCAQCMYVFVNARVCVHAHEEARGPCQVSSLVSFSLIFDLSLNLELDSLVRLANSPGTLLSLSPWCWDYRHMTIAFSLLELQLKADVIWKLNSGPLQEQYVLIQPFCFIYVCSCCVSVHACRGDGACRGCGMPLSWGYRHFACYRCWDLNSDPHN